MSPTQGNANEFPFASISKQSLYMFALWMVLFENWYGVHGISRFSCAKRFY